MAIRKLVLFLLATFSALASTAQTGALTIYPNIASVPRPTGAKDTVFAIVSGAGAVFKTRTTQGSYYLNIGQKLTVKPNPNDNSKPDGSYYEEIVTLPSGSSAINRITYIARFQTWVEEKRPYYEGGDANCSINNSTVNVSGGVLTVTPRGGPSGTYQTRLSTESSWSNSLTRNNITSSVVIFVRDAVSTTCEATLIADGSTDNGLNPPTFVAATPGTGTSILVTWTDNSTNETNFQLEFSRTSTFSAIDFTGIANANATSFTTPDNQLLSNQLYYVRVRSRLVSSSATLNSVWSNTAQVTTNALLPTVATFIVQSESTTTTSLAWVQVEGATGYTIEYGTNATTFGSSVNVGNTSSATLTNLQPGTLYHARIRATGSNRPPSQWSSTIDWYTNSTTVNLGKPSNLIVSASQTLDRTFTATWNNTAPAGQNYRLQVAPTSTFTTGVEEVTVKNSGSSATYTSTNTTTTTYFVRVRAESPTGISDWSDVKQVVTKETIPAAPTNLVATTVNTTSASYQWEYGIATNITGFELQIATNAGFTSGVQTQSVALGASPYTTTINNLSNASQYFARVRATQNAGAPGDWSNVIYITTGGSQSSLTQTGITSSTLSLSWGAIAGSSGYVVEQLSSGNVWVSKATGISGTTYTVQNLTPNTSYTFRVKGVQGTATSRPTTSLTVTTPTAVNIIYAFQNVTVTPIAGGYQLTATDPNDFGHNIRIDTSSTNEFNGPPISGVIDSDRKSVKGDLIKSYTGFPAGKTLYFRVLAWEPGYEYANAGTGWSATVSGTAGAVSGGGPVAPSNVSSQPLSPTSQRVTWQDQSNNEEGFTIQINTSSGFASGNIEKTTGPIASTGATGAVDFTGLTPNTTYYIRVRSYITGANSAWTVPVSFITPTATVPVPTITGTATSDNKQASISWTTNGATNITSYTVQRKVGGSDWTVLLDGIIPNTTSLSGLNQDQPTQIYAYRVKTVTSGSESDYSNAIQFNPPASGNSLGISIMNNGSTSKTVNIANLTAATINWSVYSGDYNAGGQFTGNFGRGIPTTGTFTATITQSLIAGQTYRLYVAQATGDPKESYVEFVQPASSNPDPTTIPTPSISGSQANDNSTANVSWTGNGATNITGWNVQRSQNGGTYALVLTNALPSVTNQTFTHSPANATYTYRVQTITNAGTSPWSSEITFAPLSGVGDDNNYPQESSQTLTSGNYNPWVKFGKFQVPYTKIAVANDFIGSEGDLKYDLGTDVSNSLSNLGIRFPGIYHKKGSDFNAGYADYKSREPLQNRYIYLGQRQYEDTQPYLGSNYLPDNNTQGYGQEWTLDDGTKFTAQNGDFKLWNIVWAWYHRNPSGNGAYNADFGIVRPNVEGHPVVGDNYTYYVKGRYLWQGGKYRPARAGGTDNTTSDGDPAYANMSDLDWFLHVGQCQVSFDDWWYSTWKNNGRETIGYQAESQGGFMSQAQNVSGYRRSYLFNQPAFNGRKYKDFMTASCYLGGDIMLDLVPFALAYTDQYDERYPEIAAFRLVRELGLAEDGTTHTGILVGGEPEFYRLTITQDSKVKLQFEDRFGNSVKTTRPMQIESALPKNTTGYGTTDVWAQIPVGTTEIEVQVNNNYLLKSSISEKCDNDLINRWEYAALYYRDMKELGLEGFPVQNQVYAYCVGQRGSQFNLELNVTGQMPKEYANGMRFMGATYNYMHVMYNTTNLNGYRTMDYIYAAQKRLSKYNSHWNDNKKAVDVEVSMDGGNTWTNSTIATYRLDLAAGGDFLVNNANAYNATWIRNRKNAGQASPLVFVSYNSVTNTAVIFEKTAFGNNLTYSLRFKKPDGSYATYLNRQTTNSWKDSVVNP